MSTLKPTSQNSNNYVVELQASEYLTEIVVN